MGTKERVFHAVLFELVALSLIIPLTAVFTGKGTGSLAMVGVGLSLYTVVWNYVYNLWFDKACAVQREQRSLKTRILHTMGFEGGLVFVTVPVVAWFLNISILAALALEAGLLVFFFFYAILFNWGYDKARARYLASREGVNKSLHRTGFGSSRI
ncbi:MAG: PACE efflux transporter [Shewanella sp.]|nr:PACE efflux transporter [Shewanella sp.]MCF1430005.1 PACE efflux transporter [Shewanella sp.]MCF1438046.1 PACE efflux transporter [Shewanella sp.]MCF1456419.1 PACE efflux transporter [Shewanella sp.]